MKTKYKIIIFVVLMYISGILSGMSIGPASIGLNAQTANDLSILFFAVSVLVFGTAYAILLKKLD